MAACTNPSVVNLDNAQRIDIVCREGDTFTIEIDFYDANDQPINLTGYTWKMEVSESDTSPTPVLDYTDFKTWIRKLRWSYGGWGLKVNMEIRQNQIQDFFILKSITSG